MDCFRLNTSNYIELTGFVDELTDIPITTATVTAKIYDEATETQLGSTLNMTHVGSGTYRASVPYDLSGLYAGMNCRVDIFADGGTGKRLTLKMKVTVISDS